MKKTKKKISHKKIAKKLLKKKPKDISKLVATRDEDSRSISLTFSPKLKQLWIKALKSGKFCKGISVLCQVRSSDFESCYCPLGVLLEVLIQNGFPIKKNKQTTMVPSPVDEPVEELIRAYVYTYQKEQAFYFLPKNLSKLIGLSHEAQQEIGLLNDNSHKQKSFREVIQAIESNEIALDIEIEKEEIDSIEHHNYPA